MSDPNASDRATAPEPLPSSEQLDRLVPVTGARSWLALAALCLLLATAVVWGVGGSVSRHVTGQGILVPLGNVLDVTAPGAGTVATISVAPGSQVQKGDLIAQLARPPTTPALDHARQVVAELKAEQARLAQQLAAQEAALKAGLERQRAALRAGMDTAGQRIALSDQALAALSTARPGDLTRQRIQDATLARQQAEQEVRRAESEMARLDSEVIEAAQRRQEELGRAQTRINDAERRIAELDVEIAAASSVLAPVAGRIIDVKVSAGSPASAGTPIASIQSGDQGLELVLYVPPRHRKDVKPGMPVQVEPASLPKDAYGTLIGQVTAISELPTPPEAMLAVLQNEDLVRRLSADGPPYVVRVRLAREPDGSLASSSGRTPGVAITPRTLAQATVTVGEDRPIALAIPLFRQATALVQ
jgi:HlyD family secretion protein